MVPPEFSTPPAQTKVRRARLLAISNRPSSPSDRLRRPDDRRSGAHFTPTFGPNSEETPAPLPWRAIRHRRKYVSNAHPVRESWWGVFSGDARPSPRRPPENYFDCFYFIIKRPVCRVWPSELISRMSKPPKCTSVYCNGRRKVGT